LENLFFIRDLEGEEYYLEGTIKHEQELNGDELSTTVILFSDVAVTTE
jgi:hypothetical protein